MEGVRGLLIGDYWLFPFQGSASSRPVAMAKRIVARTAFMLGVQFLSSDGDFSPR